RYVIAADWIFTATTVVLQPLTGLMLARMAGTPLSLPWLHRSLVLYGVAVACWIPVVFIQIRMHALVREAAAKGERAPAWQRAGGSPPGSCLARRLSSPSSPCFISW
ncbi:MAG: DUF2269 domain-containing protein, partial [Betaproteobacteria bacterium]|nr:DUF2269 domain-containing protein [Betaproteobacteria bacterium]